MSCLFDGIYLQSMLLKLQQVTEREKDEEEEEEEERSANLGPSGYQTCPVPGRVPPQHLLFSVPGGRRRPDAGHHGAVPGSVTPRTGRLGTHGIQRNGVRLRGKNKVRAPSGAPVIHRILLNFLSPQRALLLPPCLPLSAPGADDDDGGADSNDGDDEALLISIPPSRQEEEVQEEELSLLLFSSVSELALCVSCERASCCSIRESRADRKRGRGGVRKRRGAVGIDAEMHPSKLRLDVPLS
ncbi:hypothetical protein CRENBAI_019224 [Crenichthys baileyi]|uniref:Uncharacterized protein n=1 Tax=Crenichthys baileyi TaxID=28760 RepID=A0AAV9S461_9TELE